MQKNVVEYLYVYVCIDYLPQRAGKGIKTQCAVLLFRYALNWHRHRQLFFYVNCSGRLLGLGHVTGIAMSKVLFSSFIHKNVFIPKTRNKVLTFAVLVCFKGAQIHLYHLMLSLFSLATASYCYSLCIPSCYQYAMNIAAIPSKQL